MALEIRAKHSIPTDASASGRRIFFERRGGRWAYRPNTSLYLDIVLKMSRGEVVSVDGLWRFNGPFAGQLEARLARLGELSYNDSYQLRLVLNEYGLKVVRRAARLRA